MTIISLWKFLHVLSVALFAGTLLAMLMVQSLLQRALDDAERKGLARAAHTVARLVVNPLAYAAFLSGVLYWFNLFGRGASAGTLMACTPVYVHMMLLFGFLAMGLAQMWKAQARKLVVALDEGRPATEARRFVARGWIFALVGLALIVATFGIAIVRVPNPVLTHCGGG